jgi:hypothetical protein
MGPNVAELQVIRGHERKAKIGRKQQGPMNADSILSEQNDSMATIPENPHLVKSSPNEARHK